MNPTGETENNKYQVKDVVVGEYNDYFKRVTIEMNKKIVPFAGSSLRLLKNLLSIEESFNISIIQGSSTVHVKLYNETYVISYSKTNEANTRYGNIYIPQNKMKVLVEEALRKIPQTSSSTSSKGVPVKSNKRKMCDSEVDSKKKVCNVKQSTKDMVINLEGIQGSNDPSDDEDTIPFHYSQLYSQQFC
jgi:hypothetical protein